MITSPQKYAIRLGSYPDICRGFRGLRGWKLVCSESRVLLQELTREIIGAAMEVHRSLGPGFVESIYRNALSQELTSRGLNVQTEQDVEISYKGYTVGRHRLDLMVNHCVIVELKAVSCILDVHIAQVLSYLKATELEVSLILNFGSVNLGWKRYVKSRN